MRHLKSTVALVLVFGCVLIAAQGQKACQGIVLGGRGTRYCVTAGRSPTNKLAVYTYTNMANGEKMYTTQQGVNADGTPIYVASNEDGTTPVTPAPAPETNNTSSVQ